MARIQDVAKHANVSVSTVSYVLSGKRPISGATKDRVRTSIKTLGYQPHASARALAGSRTNVLGLVMPLRSGVHVPVVMQFMASVITRARELDYDVLVLTKDEGEQGLHRVQESSLADVLVLMDVERHDARLSFLGTLGTPSVLIGFPARPGGHTCIDLDFKAAGVACVDYLADLGHRCLGFIGSPYEVYQRETGYATRLMAGIGEAAKVRRVHATALPCEPTLVGLRHAVADLLLEHPELTGLIVHNEAVVEGLASALREHGRRVPEDISVIAVGPEDLARRFDMTTMVLPTGYIGRRAVELALGKLDGNGVPGATLLAPRLTGRDSTCSAPHKRIGGL